MAGDRRPRAATRPRRASSTPVPPLPRPVGAPCRRAPRAATSSSRGLLDRVRSAPAGEAALTAAPSRWRPRVPEPDGLRRADVPCPGRAPTFRLRAARHSRREVLMPARTPGRARALRAGRGRRRRRRARPRPLLRVPRGRRADVRQRRPATPRPSRPPAAACAFRPYDALPALTLDVDGVAARRRGAASRARAGTGASSTRRTWRAATTATRTCSRPGGCASALAPGEVGDARCDDRRLDPSTRARASTARRRGERPRGRPARASASASRAAADDFLYRGPGGRRGVARRLPVVRRVGPRHLHRPARA